MRYAGTGTFYERGPQRKTCPAVAKGTKAWTRAGHGRKGGLDASRRTLWRGCQAEDEEAVLCWFCFGHYCSTPPCRSRKVIFGQTSHKLPPLGSANYFASSDNDCHQLPPSATAECHGEPRCFSPICWQWSLLAPCILPIFSPVSPNA